MKTILICKKTFFTLFAAGIMTVPVLLSSCNKDYNGTNSSSQMYTTTGSASGAQENPPVTSSGTGTLTGTYNSQTNSWQYNITWSAISDVTTAFELHVPA